MTRREAVEKTVELLKVDITRVSTARNRTPYTGCELMLCMTRWLASELIGRGSTWEEAYIDVKTRKAVGLIED